MTDNQTNKQTVEQYNLEIEKELNKTDFYDNIIMFCGPIGSPKYNEVLESIASTIVMGHANGAPVEFMVKILLESNHAAADYLLTNYSNVIKH